VRSPVRLAQEVGARLAGREVLLRAMPAGGEAGKKQPDGEG